MRPPNAKKSGSLAVLTCVVGALAIFASTAFAKEDAFVKVDRKKVSESAHKASMVVRATGTGYESPRHSGPQARLMARRAAIVDGYRKLAAMRGRVVSSLTGRTYYESVTDFVKGATVVETRYYYDGHVEADMELPVSVSRVGGRSVSYENLTNVLRENGVAVVEVEPERREITKEEWQELFAKREKQKTEEGESEAEGQ